MGKIKTVKIGIDFGTSYSFAGFLHGDAVMPLIPSSETWGIPSVFYYDGKQKLTGSMAQRKAMQKPEYAVRSVKRKLKEGPFTLGGNKKFTAEEVVYEIIANIIEGAQQQLSVAYLQEYDEMEATITVPVDFSDPMKKLIRDAAERVKLKNGKHIHVTGVIPEPIAASIEYFGVKQEKDANIVVVDLGGGTFDAAIVRANAGSLGIPYEIIDQEGDKALGGDDWDHILAEWLEGEYIRQVGGKITPQLKAKLEMEARQIKEDLTHLESVTQYIEVKGDDFEVTITRAEFERKTKHLMDRVIEMIRTLLGRNGEIKIDHVIMTGGSCYMPQVRQRIASSGLFERTTDIQLVEPEHAIAYGAARYAETVEWNSQKITKKKEIIKLKATHSYGILYRDSSNREHVTFWIGKGEELPVVKVTDAYTRFDGHREVSFPVFETDQDVKLKENIFDTVKWGNQVLSVLLTHKDKNVPKGTKMTATLTLTEGGWLSIKAVNEKDGNVAEGDVNVTLKRF